MKARYEAIDLLRGFIMILMALDHASAMIARVHFLEIWGDPLPPYPSTEWWWTRFVSHLCAPGFFLLMGWSMGLFTEKRRQIGWDDRKIRNYFLKRGGLILGIMLLLELPGWGLSMAFGSMGSETLAPGAETSSFAFPTTVLYGLGSCMLISAFLLRQQKLVLLLIAIACFAGSAFYLSELSFHSSFSLVEQLLLVPGQSSGAMVLYPIIPWIGVTSFGLFWSQRMLERPDKVYNDALFTGLLFIVIFIGLRLMQLGNFQENTYNNWVAFFTLIKYPPSLTFIFLTCGINLFLLWAFSQLAAQQWLSPVRLFGQTAMFFYIIHLYLYALLGAPFPNGTSIANLYLFWIIGLFLLYFICQRFLRFKRAKAADSIWKMI